MGSFKLKRTIFSTKHILNYFFIDCLKYTENIHESIKNNSKILKNIDDIIKKIRIIELKRR